jgi:amino-acid N-acetyltransferase
VTISPAARADLPAVRHLLEAAHLPLDDVEETLSTMVVAGAAAVELYADGALLRSVVVSPVVQGQGVGHRLTEAALNIAQRCDMKAVFLLTTTAEQFFPRLGFEQISRADVPESVQASVEFQSACPASATVMRKQLV